ncbi:MAG: ral stress protein CsbD [Bacteroidetes bacterium]|nr:ral stress protein CsbD [Bacteroidota bacterium]
MINTPSTPITWNEQKAKLKAKFGILVDSDLNYSEEKKDDMFRKLQEKLGHTKAELEAIIDLV